MRTSRDHVMEKLMQIALPNSRGHACTFVDFVSAYRFLRHHLCKHAGLWEKFCGLNWNTLHHSTVDIIISDLMASRQGMVSERGLELLSGHRNLAQRLGTVDLERARHSGIGSGELSTAQSSAWTGHCRFLVSGGCVFPVLSLSWPLWLLLLFSSIVWVFQASRAAFRICLDLKGELRWEKALVDDKRAEHRVPVSPPRPESCSWKLYCFMGKHQPLQNLNAGNG
jgi:hypothetical protein